MPDIEVTEDQRERLRNVEEALADEVVGKYGIVRTRDAVEYLLDRYEADDGIAADVVEEDAAPASAVETDGDAESEESETSDENEDDEPESADDEKADEGSGDDEDDDAEAEDEDEADEDEDEDDDDDEDEAGDDDDEDAEADEGDDDEDAEADEGEDDEDEDDEEDETGDPAANGGDMLSAMQSLLDDHDDKWGEGSGDDRYEVELPDGSTESARTKDDVRALLFEHYR